jgi:hypothetical protein
MPFCCTENEGEPVFGEQVTALRLPKVLPLCSRDRVRRRHRCVPRRVKRSFSTGWDVFGTGQKGSRQGRLPLEMRLPQNDVFGNQASDTANSRNLKIVLSLGNVLDGEPML